jgi:4'-phosphopantetheinyl transferase
MRDSEPPILHPSSLVPHPSPWPLPPAEIDLPPGEVHLWSAPLDVPEDLLRRFAGTLSDDENRRAERFRFGVLRDHYIAGRGTLRMLLARYLQAQPAEYSLSYQAHGKPELGAPCPPFRTGESAARLEFNVSHSHGLAVYAFTLANAIGVDVESIRPMPRAAELMERFFSPQEVEQWRQMPSGGQLRTFFLGWTRKEAWLKAVGSGLSFPLNEFCVTLDDPARVLSIRGDKREAAQWRLESCEPCEGFVASVALRGEATAVRKWRFSP